MKKILITGGNGFFGSRFTQKYGSENHIISTDVDTLNILDRDAVLRTVVDIEPDIIIHAAAIALTGFCNENPDKCRNINVGGALNMGEAALSCGADLIFLSSEQVYNGNSNKGPFRETDKPVPDTVYGKNKKEAEELLSGMVERLRILRFTWMFGVPGKSLPVVNNVLWDTVISILKGERFGVSPNEYRGLTLVDDMINNFEKVFSLPYGLYHIGSENELSRYEIVRLIFNELGLGSRFDELVICEEKKYRDNPRDVRLNMEKIRTHGLEFDSTPEALIRCISDYNISV